jgi:hypothetical protein
MSIVIALALLLAFVRYFDFGETPAGLGRRRH